MIRMIIACVLASISMPAFSTIGAPQEALCTNGGSGEFLYSVKTERTESGSKSTIRNPATVQELAVRLNAAPQGHAAFETVELVSTSDSCQSNPQNAFAYRCHPELSVAFVSGTERVEVPVSFASIWVTRHIHETAFTTWDEYTVSVGVIPDDGQYSHHDFVIDHPSCVATAK